MELDKLLDSEEFKREALNLKDSTLSNNTEITKEDIEDYLW